MSCPAARRLLLLALLVSVVGACASGQSSAPPVSPLASASPSTIPMTTAVPTSPTQVEIDRLLAAVAANPEDAEAHRDLGFAFLQRARETAEPGHYDSAEVSFERARELAPDDALVLVGIGGLQLARHQFAEAFETGREAAALSPSLAAARAVVVDALVELARYDEADAAAAEMLALSQDLTTLTRISYLAELRGNLPKALAAMRLAAESPGLAPENTAFAQALLGNLLRYTGDPGAAAAAYEVALELVPDYAPALAGQARLAVGEGDLDAALARYRRAASIVPLPEYVISQGDTEAAAGLAENAQDSFALARAQIRLFEAAGVTVDLDLALFEAEHGDAAKALELARTVYSATPTIRAADAVAWALHKLGRDQEASTFAEEALRLGSRDPLLRYHSGAIAAAVGDAETSRRDLEMALATDPGFSATGAAEARRLLDQLGS